MTVFSSFSHKKSVFLAVLISLIWIYGGPILSGTFGELGSDPDDIMRFIQIRDWMNGQSWFDTDQYRLGGATGTDMHWSRLPDVPVAALAWIFDIFMPQDRALHLAAAIWAPLLGAMLLVIIAQGAKRLATPATHKPAVLAALGLGLIFVCRSIRFNSGALDHHNLQVVLLAGCLVSLLSESRVKNGFFGGAAMGTALAIGPEVYPFIAFIGLFVALDWAWLGQTRRNRTMGFGLGFTVSLAGLFILTVAPSQWTQSYCDQLSIVNVLAGLGGGSGLALAAWKLSLRQIGARALALSAIGIMVIVLIGAIAPQCFSNPLDALPENMHKFWLDHISEAKPLLGGEEDRPLYEVLYFIGPLIVMIFVLGFDVFKRGATSSTVLLLMLLTASLIMTIYQVRFYIFAHLFTILPSAIWIGNCYAVGKQKKDNVAYLGALVLSLPIFWVTPSYFLAVMSDEELVSEDGDEVGCGELDVMTALNNLPTSTIFASPSHGADILKSTQHHVLTANYHRNIEGIEAGINIDIASSEGARKLLEKYGIDYVMTCSTDDLTDLYGKDYPNSFSTEMELGNVPKWLAVQDESLSEGNVKLYRVLR